MRKTPELFRHKKYGFFGRILGEVLPPMGNWARNERQTDELTRLPNLRAAQALIPRWLHQAGGNFYLAFADMDYFKPVNDCHSHDAGDFVLVAFAGLAMRFFPDRVFRIGGEEFLWCHEGAEKDVLHLAEEFRRAVENETTPAANRLLAQHYVRGQHERTNLIHYPVTVSQGIVQAGRQAPSFGALKAGADASLYLAKDMGRNAVFFRSKLISQGEPPIHYTRPLVKLLHEMAKQRGFTCWWDLRSRLGGKEREKIIRLGRKRIHEMERSSFRPA